MGGFLNIAEGHINEVLGFNTNVSEARLKICKKCPLYHIGLFGPVCSMRLWLNPETGDISSEQKDGYIRGCGCRLDAKTRVINESCRAGKW